jgi:hypothetical protein
MFDGMSVTSILGAGAIGLGFLLALLTYNLLRQKRPDNTPIYVFQFFCFALVLIGAVLQYSATGSSQKIENLQDQVKSLQKDLEDAQSSLPELQKTKASLSTAMQTAKTVDASLFAMQQAITKVVKMVPGSIENLNAVNAVLTGNVCSGGRSGIPIHGGAGTAAAARSTEVISNLSAAKSSLESFLVAVPK